jgi:(R,R)-butanediol dehydrogenase/meso-butanediol dehydrogenase/diacetyl reductase
MKAAIFYNAKDIRIENIPEPIPGKGQVKIKVEWCGICGTDLHEYDHGPVMVSTSPHPLTGEKSPMILGHEFSGVIAELGPDVQGNWKVGDRVTADPCCVCHECYNCKNNHYNICSSLGFIGLARDGAFAEYTLVDDYQLCKLPDEVSFEQGAFTEPVAVVLHAVRRAGISLGDTVLVTGLGPIGLLAGQCAKAAGAAAVYGVELSEARLQSALKLGFTEVFNPKEQDVVAEIKKRTDGIGCHMAINCNGNNATMRTCLDATRGSATIICPGHGGEFMNIASMEDLNFPEKQIMGSHVYVNEFSRSLALMSDGRINTEGVTSGKIKLDDIVEKGFKELLYNTDKNLKIIVSPK